MKLVLHIITNDAGGAAVLTPEHRVRAMARAYERRAAQLEKEAQAEPDERADKLATAKTLRESAKQGLEEWREIMDRYEGQAQTLEFDIRAYTYGEKLRARKAATPYKDGVPQAMDYDEYLLALTCAVTGKPREEIEALPPIVYAHLSTEIAELSEPDPGKLDFLSTSPSGLGRRKR